MMIYSHVLNKGGRGVISPIDRMEQNLIHLRVTAYGPIAVARKPDCPVSQTKTAELLPSHAS
jgi:hypothetical protein